jgi:hypothetical protein
MSVIVVQRLTRLGLALCWSHAPIKLAEFIRHAGNDAGNSLRMFQPATVHGSAVIRCRNSLWLM